MAATRSVERACLGAFREEIRGVGRSVIFRSGECEYEMRRISRISHPNARPKTEITQMTSQSTLTTTPVAPLLDRLFTEAEATSPMASPALAALSGDHERLMRSKTEYASFYGSLKDYPLAVSRETGLLLYMLARGMRARSIVEFGTSFG